MFYRVHLAYKWGSNSQPKTIAQVRHKLCNVTPLYHFLNVPQLLNVILGMAHFVSHGLYIMVKILYFGLEPTV